MADRHEPTGLPLRAGDGHRWNLYARVPTEPTASLLWLPALGVAARHYLPFADALAARGIAVYVHEWRGNGSSSVRASRDSDWGYRELLLDDLPVSDAAVAAALPQLPRIIGGHSLGGQLACMRLGLASLRNEPALPSSLWLVASGAPYWRTFPMPQRIAMPPIYRFLPWLARVNGTLPGRRIGFGGNEARSLIRDWGRTALSGRYAAAGIDADVEAGMAQIAVDARAVSMDGDWLVPPGSVRYLLSKLPRAQSESLLLGTRALGTRADHFSWMKQPEAVVEALLRR
ncbi:alpha/beta hydrolase family protein [Lysobacter antibioticus]|uniref:Alpha/beta hydrolase family protein n=1 Tax=Lysobacter antibioticus TaxID=84531 RepID=A0A0S2F9Q3_LYSAN|nr:alpha/beta fold hydrolase [Lysobacter antibioticus]ALN80189.1 alpha/beta hydrolase family protein [Lysobacter antibioticus]